MSFSRLLRCTFSVCGRTHLSVVMVWCYTSQRLIVEIGYVCYACKDVLNVLSLRIYLGIMWIFRVQVLSVTCLMENQLEWKHNGL